MGYRPSIHLHAIKREFVIFWLIFNLIFAANSVIFATSGIECRLIRLHEETTALDFYSSIVHRDDGANFQKGLRTDGQEMVVFQEAANSCV